ncbi:unnamed protein product [Mytilus coruscus]|uniref:Immunoglobulin domain-containing protein n=1 Tax=Mytilus coruscus TaxID=42192 RepID=A0A6J8A328_MYTCO|nr:unnamed protein product [Mytilus coruscus]
MLAILAVIAIAVTIQMISGIGNETIKVKVQKGRTIVLKCSISEGEATWLGPDVNNAGQGNVIYFLNNDKNPNLNLTKYSLQENAGGYDLIIVNFQEENTGCYFCRFSNDGLFHEMRYNVSLLVPKSKQGNKEQSSIILLVLLPVVLIGGSFTIIGLLARVKGITIDLDVSVDTGATSNYRNTDESTAVKLYVISIVLSVAIVIDCE